MAERRHRPADRTDFSRYFQDELRYLEELGAEHARQDPGRSHFDFATINDPDVLCLLHGFSFLTARIRQNLDNDLPELSHTLCALLYPHYLRSVPALTVVQFSPDPATVQSRLTIPRGTRVQSEPLDDVACVFRTCYDVEVVPIELRRCRFERTGARGAVIRLGFESVGPADLASIDLSSIRLYLRGGGEEARMLYWLLSSEVDSATLVWEDDEGKVVRRTRSAHDAIRRVGFECGNPNDERTSLLPFPTRSFPAYRLLQEYFAFEQKFLFLDLVLTDAPEGKAFSEVTRLRHFEVELNLPETPDGLPPIDEASIGLHCSPSVNLFAHDAEPVVVDHTRSEYLVRPSGGGRRTHEVWSVEKVEAIDPFSAEIPDFHAPRPRSRKDGDRALFYESLLQPSRVGFVDGRDEDVGPSGTDTFLRFVDPEYELIEPSVSDRGDSAVFTSKNLKLSVELLCTNRALPVDLEPSQISVATDDLPKGLEFSAIERIQAPVAPPLGDLTLWRLISHLSLSRRGFEDVEVLKGLLEIYDFHARADQQARRRSNRRIDALKSLTTERRDAFYRGAYVPLVRTRLEVDMSGFMGVGDLYLFGSVLDHFVALRVSVNCISQFVITVPASGLELEYPRRAGTESVL